jgi:hypothetical protein
MELYKDELSTVTLYSLENTNVDDANERKSRQVREVGSSRDTSSSSTVHIYVVRFDDGKQNRMNNDFLNHFEKGLNYEILSLF